MDAKLLNEDLIDRWNEEGLYLDITLWDCLERADQSKIAIITEDEGQVSYFEIQKRALNLAHKFIELGLQSSDVVILQLPNCIDLIISHLALTRVGAITLALLPSYRKDEVAKIMGLSGAIGIVYRSTDQTYIRNGDTYSASSFDARMLKFALDTSTQEFQSINKTERTLDNISVIAPSPSEVTILMATSGTTGTPKIVTHSHRSTIGCVLEVANTMNLTSNDVMFMPSPLAHATGLQYGIRMSIALGSTLVLMTKWSKESAIEIIESTKATWMMGATPFLFDLLNVPEIELQRIRSMRTFVCGGSPIPEVLAMKAHERIPDMNLLTAWGMSETGIATLVRPNDPIEKSIKTDGLPIRGFEVRIVNAEGKDCSIYETGEILVRGPSLFHGYLNDESNNKTSLDNGWLKSGDLGFIDNDGYLRCDGRIKDLIVRGGLNISPAEVEGLLLTHPLIEDVSVVGLPDDRLGERVFAFLVCPSVNLTLKELSEFLTTKGLSIQKHPEQVLFVPELPKTATGKTLKNQLRQTLTAQNKHS